jgi:uncharacterized protein
MSAPRVVLDTNVLASGVSYPLGPSGRILTAWRLGSVEVVLSRYILDEFVRIVPRVVQDRISAEKIRNLADTFLFFAELVEPIRTHDPQLRDPGDDPVLGTLIAGAADHLLTGDKDLLALADRYPILTPAAFCQRYGL